MTKKILYVITKSNWGGAQRYVYDLATSLPKTQSTAIVACGGNGLLIPMLKTRGVRVLPISHLQRDVNITKEMRSLVSLWRTFKEERPDVVHLNSSKAGGLGALAARIAGVPHVVFTAHGWAFSEDRSMAARALIWFLSFLTALFAHRVIVITKRDYALCRYFFGIPKKKFILIPIGIDPHETAMRDRASARAELGLTLPENAFIAGTITEFTPNKGVRTSIAAMTLVPQEVSMVFVGGGEEEAAMRILAAKTAAANRIIFPGFRPHAARLLKAFDIFIFPSLKEGLPYALLEAGCAELPVIASGVGGIPDIITHGENGILIDPKNPAMLAARITLLFRDPELRTRLGKNLRERVLKQFSKELMVKNTTDLYGL